VRTSKPCHAIRVYVAVVNYLLVWYIPYQSSQCFVICHSVNQSQKYLVCTPVTQMIQVSYRKGPLSQRSTHAEQYVQTKLTLTLSCVCLLGVSTRGYWSQPWSRYCSCFSCTTTERLQWRHMFCIFSTRLACEVCYIEFVVYYINCG